MRSAMILAAMLVSMAARAAVVASNESSSASAPGGNININLDAIGGKQAASDADAADQATLAQARKLIDVRQSQAAVDLLDPLIAAFDKRWRDSPSTVFCVHSQAETLLYMATATVAGHDAVAVDATYCDALYLRGYSRIDLGRASAAEADLQRALALAPHYPHYLSELGALHTMMRDWPVALKYYAQARDEAPTYSAEGKADAEMGVALRGTAYIDVELGKLEEAEALYRRCLEIDANDRKAQGELGYVQVQKAKRDAVAR